VILRMWRARSSVEKAGEYIHHFTTKVLPALRAIEGHRGAYLLRRAVGDAIEFVVITLWESMKAARSFTGVKPEKAVIEAEARAILTSFDESVCGMKDEIPGQTVTQRRSAAAHWSHSRLVPSAATVGLFFRLHNVVPQAAEDGRVPNRYGNERILLSVRVGSKFWRRLLPHVVRRQRE